MTLPNLPELNQEFTSKIHIPSLGKEFKARPYLTKEEKILLIAFEANDARTIFDAVIQVLNNCVNFENYSIYDLTMFDLEYAFVQLRTISVGEGAELKVKCSNCEAENEIRVDLRAAALEKRNYQETMHMQDGISIVLTYPKVKHILTNADKFFNNEKDKLQTEEIFAFLLMAIDKVIYAEESYNFDDYPLAQREHFLEGFSKDQLEKVSEFLAAKPEVQLTHNYQCTSCGSEEKLELSGMNDFF